MLLELVGHDIKKQKIIKSGLLPEELYEEEMLVVCLAKFFLQRVVSYTLQALCFFYGALRLGQGLRCSVKTVPGQGYDKMYGRKNGVMLFISVHKMRHPVNQVCQEYFGRDVFFSDKGKSW